MVNRGQAYTLEGVLAAILVVTATVYGLQAIDTRAWEDNTSEETQQLENRASDVLTLASESGALRNATVCYRPGQTIDVGGNQAGSEFEQMLNITFDNQVNEYNLYFSYWNDSDARESRLVSQRPESGDIGPPTSAAAASTTVTLTDTMKRTNDNCDPIPPTIKETEDSFYMSDAAPDSALFNIVEVRLVVW